MKHHSRSEIELSVTTSVEINPHQLAELIHSRLLADFVVKGGPDDVPWVAASAAHRMKVLGAAIEIAEKLDLDVETEHDFN